MQGVQTTLDYKAELNLIEWVWYQEWKVKEHWQVESAFWYSCTASGSASYQATNTERQSTTNQWNLSITESIWVTEFSIQQWWLRIPMAWPYLVEISVKWWASSMKVTNYIRLNWDTIYQQETTSGATTITTELLLNLWKFDILSFWGDMYYSGSSSSASGSSTATIKIKRL